MITLVRTALIAASFASGASAAAGTTIRVDVTGFKSTTGEVRCAMFRGPSGFPRNLEQAEARVQATIKSGAATCVFENVPPGPAAVTVIHDANNNKKLDFKFGFIPSEGLGWTNNRKVGMRPPPFDAASFDVGAAPITTAVRLLHR